MEIVMKKNGDLLPPERTPDHGGGGGRHRHGAGVLVPGLAGRWRTGRPLAALVVGTAVAYALIGLGMVFLIALGLTVIPGKP